MASSRVLASPAWPGDDQAQNERAADPVASLIPPTSSSYPSSITRMTRKAFESLASLPRRRRLNMAATYGAGVACGTGVFPSSVAWFENGMA
jgi:hypothetical protein